MKKITRIMGSLAFALGLFTSAHAGTDMKEITAPEKPSNWYIGVFGGAAFSQDYNGASSNFQGSNSGTDSIVKDDVGGLGGLKVGYNFASYDLGGGFAIVPAVEAEAAYIDSQVPLSKIVNETMNSEMNSVEFGVNGLAKLKTGTIFTPYLGLGIGGQWIQLSNVTFTTKRVFTDPGTTTTQYAANDQSDLDFTFQGIVGFDVEVASNWDLFTEYKYLVAVDPSFTWTNAGGTTSSYTYKDAFLGQDLITAGIKYNF